MSRPGTLALVLVLLAGCGRGASRAAPSDVKPPPPPPPPPPAEQNPIAQENALPGDPGWQLHQRAAPGVLEGYAGAVSVEHGEAVDVHVRSDRVGQVQWGAWRLGWYAGTGGRLLASGGPVSVGPQPVPAPDPVTGKIACSWPVTFTIRTDRSWTSGIYVVVLTRDDGPQIYVPFVVRADERKGVAALQAAVTTWQAYNPWGGKSLYPPDPGGEVSFDRPYAEGSGAGRLFRYEQPFLSWAESRGFDVTYLTGPDLDRDPSLLQGQRLFLSVGHDEYWSRPQRDAVEAALAAGTSLAFLGGNTMFWQIRLEPADGSPADRRTQVGWKRAAPTSDPMRGTPLETTQWRLPPVNDPESALLGVLYTALEKDPPGRWIVASSTAWPYAGTGLSDGDAIDGIVGYETDRTDPSTTPPGTIVLAHSPVTDASGRADVQEAALRELPNGAFVLAVGTVDWPTALPTPGIDGDHVRQITENVLRQAGLAPDPGVAPASASR